MQSGKHYSQLAMAGVAGLAAVTLVAGCGSSSSSGSGTVVPSGKASASSGGGGGGGGSSAGTDSSNPHALLAASVDKTEATKNAKLHIDVKASSGGQDINFGGDGIIDFAGKKFQISITLPSSAGGGGTIEERLIGKDLYLKLPSQLSAASGGKAWVKVDSSQLSGTGTTNGLGSFQQDPTQFLSTLRSVSNSVAKVGTQTIRGVETTHYRAEVDLAKAASANGGTDNAAAIAQYQKLLGSSTLPEDVYLDDQGLARRFSVSIDASKGSLASTGASLGSFSTTVDLYDFGSTDTSGIVAPPASDVGSLPTGTGLGG